MNQRFTESIQKQELEKRIVEARSNLQMSNSDLSCLSSKEFIALIDAFNKLHLYYLKNDNDTSAIYFEVLNTYLDITRPLNLLLRHNKYPDQEEVIQDKLDALEYIMDGLISAGYRQLNNPPNK